MKIVWSRDALKTLQEAGKSGQRLVEILEAYAADPRAQHPAVKPLVGTKTLRARSGDWRAIFQVEAGALHVLSVRRRNEGTYR